MKKDIVVYVVDIGSLRRNNFAWVRMWGEAVSHRGTAIAELKDLLVQDLNGGASVACGFECPLSGTYAETETDIGGARTCDGNRPWSASAGAQSLVTGLSQICWILKELRGAREGDWDVHLEWDSFVGSDSGLFIWEAFVSNKEERAGATHMDDAELAARHFLANMTKLAEEGGFVAEPAISVVGAALMRTEWCNDPAVLGKHCLVVKPPCEAKAGPHSVP